MDSMYAHLTSGAALPPSQVVRPTPRGFAPYTPATVPVLLPRAVEFAGGRAIASCSTAGCSPFRNSTIVG